MTGEEYGYSVTSVVRLRPPDVPDKRLRTLTLERGLKSQRIASIANFTFGIAANLHILPPVPEQPSHGSIVNDLCKIGDLCGLILSI